MTNLNDKNNLWFDSKGVHADHTDVSLRQLMRIAAAHYKPGASRYFDVIVRDVFVGKLALKIDKQTKHVDMLSLSPERKFK